MLESELPMLRRMALPILLFPVLLATSCERPQGFRHGAHVTLAEGECAICHGEDSDAPRRPAAADCLACHPDEKRFLPPSAPGPPRGEEEVPFSHRRHRRAGIACGQCHPSSPGRAEPPPVPGFPECGGCH